MQSELRLLLLIDSLLEHTDLVSLHITLFVRSRAFKFGQNRVRDDLYTFRQTDIDGVAFPQHALQFGELGGNALVVDGGRFG